MRHSHDRIRWPWLPVFAADFLAIVAAYYTTFLFRFHSEWGRHLFDVVNPMLNLRSTGFIGDLHRDFYLESGLRIVTQVTLLLVLLYAVRDLYAGRRFLRRRTVAWDVIWANAVALAVFFSYFYLRRNVFHPRSFFVMTLSLNVVYCVGFRSALAWCLQAARERYRFDVCRAVLVGQNREADMVDGLLGAAHPAGICVVERLRAETGDIEDLVRLIESAVVRQGAALVICAEKDRSVSDIMRLLEAGGQWRVDMKLLSEHLSVLAHQARVPTDRVHGLPLVHFGVPPAGRAWRVASRAFSAAMACAILVVLSPLLLVLSALIRVTSRGPVLFVQERIGVNRRPFRMLKFRTMYDQSEETQAQLEEFNESGEALFKIRKDPRVTPVGRFLRRFSLDELPQLLNVVKGDMRIVGPRPLPRRDFQNYYEDWHYSRHSGMPGLTCLWQVSGRSDLGFRDMCILDVYYLRNQSWVLDLRIMLKTVWVVLFAKGAY